MGGFHPYEKIKYLIISNLQFHRPIRSLRLTAEAGRLCRRRPSGVRTGRIVDHQVEIAGDGIDLDGGEHIAVADIAVTNHAPCFSVVVLRVKPLLIAGGKIH